MYIYIYISEYVCIYVCMCVCVSVCVMYVYTDNLGHAASCIRTHIRVLKSREGASTTKDAVCKHIRLHA